MYTHVHTKAIRGPKPKSGETDLWFSLFLNRNTKLTSSRRIFQLLLFSASITLFFPSAYSSALPHGLPPYPLTCVKALLQIHVPGNGDPGARWHCRRQWKPLVAEIAILQIRQSLGKLRHRVLHKEVRGDEKRRGRMVLTDKPFFFSATVQPSYI